MYRFTEYAKNRPIRLRHEGVWVSLGADVTITREPPLRSEVIKAAGQEAMKKLIEKYPKYIEYVEDDEINKSAAVERQRFSGGKDAVR